MEETKAKAQVIIGRWEKQSIKHEDYSQLEKYEKHPKSPHVTINHNQLN